MPLTEVLRNRGDERQAHVTNMELFFDLVFVYAFTQVSEHLYEQLTWTGALEMAVIFMALWWAWNYTAWATNWIDPEKSQVVGLLSVLMVASMVMAAAILEAFGHRGEMFAIAYVFLQVTRSSFMVWAFGLKGRADPEDKMGRNFAQLLAWSVISGVVWIVGGFVHDSHTRLWIWLAAAAIDLTAPMRGFWLPGLGSTPMSDWTLAGGHLAERCQLLLMIAFGETLLRVGESFTNSDLSAKVDLTFALGFLLIFALWSIYFLHHAEHGARAIEEAEEEDAARLGRSAYAYAHMILVGAVIVVAVAVHMAVEHPSEHASAAFAGICMGGPAIYLLGLTLSKRYLGHGRLLPPMLGVLALVVLGFAVSFSDRLSELIAATVVVTVMSVWARAADRAQTGSAVVK